jgi:gliding motility-associated-like protein
MKTIKGIQLRATQFIILIFITAAASAQLKADFAATPTTGCPPLVVSFQDKTTGNPSSWKWDLGNGTISYLQNPVASYFNPGVFNVKLIVKSASGEDSIAKSQYIVVNELPKPAFGASDSSGCFPLKVKFTDSSLAGSGTVSAWQWDFGDGTLSTDKDPTHTYTNPGNFTVILKVTNSNGCSRVITKPAYIKVPNGVKANFTYSSVNGCSSPQSISFTNTSTSTGPQTYKWDFGDGNTSTATNPVNSYNTGGSYTVKLIAITAFGCSDTMTVTNAVNFGSVKADFTPPAIICVGSPAQFTNTSNPATYVSTNWFFSDGTTSSEISPNPVFTMPGVYQVKLVTDFGTCKDSVVKSVTVADKPTAGFTASNFKACKGPLNVTFTNTSVNGTSFTWNFGDNSTSTIRNPVHTYTNAGTYTVTLTAKNAAGCEDVIVKQELVRIVPPKILSLQNLGVKGCIPLTITPDAIIQDSVAGSTYLWEFGDGSTSTVAKPSHTYTTTGNFNVKLTITTPAGCTDTLTFVGAVKAGVKPNPKFSATPTNVCALSPVTFTDLSTNGQMHEWLWTFHDGSISTDQNPIHTFNDTGKFDITLVVYNFGCSDTLTLKNYIYVMPPIAKFDTSFLCNVPMTRNFIDSSVGAKTWQWSFGDGGTSTQKNPSHTYAGSGTYSVKLLVSNGACTHEIKKDVVVVKEHATLQLSDTVGCLGARIIFTAANINQSNISLYAWYFNGLTEAPIITGNSPIAWTFNEPGSHPMALILTDILNCTDTSYTTPFNIYGARADFSSVLSKTCFGNTINFNDSSKSDGIHSIKEWTWNYGEGAPQVYTSAPFFHDYTTPGDYNITLKVKDSFGCVDSITKPAFVSVTKPVAKFTPSDSVLCPAVPVTFNNLSNDAGAGYSWDFGDGTSSTDFSPSHSYANAGAYTIKMTMVDKNGCQDIASSIINVFTARADFSMSDSFSTCPPLVVNITNKSPMAAFINWDFGDGGNSQLANPSHIYTYPGNYTVKLTVANNGGCTSELTKNVTIEGPTGSFIYTPQEICNPGEVSFKLASDDAVKFIWDYNDGNTIFTTTPTSIHKYIESGIYIPKVIIEDAGGCRVAIQGRDTIKVYGIHTGIKSSKRLVCDSGLVSFQDSTVSNDAIASYLWNFGDGNTSAASNPTHNYAKTGFYSVKLVTTTNFGCVDSALSNNYIKVVNSPEVKISGNLSACEPAKLKFTGDFVRADTSVVTWRWNFGNGNTSTLNQPDSQLYRTPGNYTVGVTATNSDGCIDTVSATVTVHPNPVVDAGPDTMICRFSPYTLNASGADTYTWRSTATLSCTTCASPGILPADSSRFYVKGKTAFGCEAEDSVTVKVKQPFKMKVNNADTVCIGSAVTLTASGADKYQWKPALWLSNPNIATPVSRPDSSITYQVIGADNKGCFQDTANVSVKVYALPKVEITNGDKVTVQVGSTVKLSTKSSADVTSFRWNPGQWLSCITCAEPVVSPKDNITYTVTATNAGKCVATDQVTVNVICGNANVYMPNTFSPNGDGSNDAFFPRGTGLYNIKSLKVFNRWGECVFDKRDISANKESDGWNGSNKGVPMPTDVYVYVLEVICANNVVFSFKGNVTLIR